MALTDKLTAIANAIRAKTGGTATMTLDEMPTEIASISGGGDITDGTVIHARDASGYPTSMTVYGTPILRYAYSSKNASSQYRKVSNLVLDDSVLSIDRYSFEYVGAEGTGFNLDTKATTIDQYSFQYSGAKSARFREATSTENWAFLNCLLLTSVIADKLTTVGDHCFEGCSNLLTVSMSRCNLLWDNAFKGCTSLSAVELGSVGYGFSNAGFLKNTAFAGCTQSGLAITVFTKLADTNIDTLIANIRNGATNAVITVKAAVSTTYGGTSFAAGDTITISGGN